MKYEEWKWSDDFLTTKDEINYQHKTLFNIINDLIRACNMSEEEPNGLLVEVALDELLKYAGYHFGAEEHIMSEHNYAGLVEHKAQHQSFVVSMLKFKERFNNNENIASELLTFMKKWLVDHILTKDKIAMAHCQSAV